MKQTADNLAKALDELERTFAGRDRVELVGLRVRLRDMAAARLEAMLREKPKRASRKHKPKNHNVVAFKRRTS